MVRRAMVGRAGAWVVLGVLAGCPVARGPAVGDPCAAGEVACSDAAQALSCRDGALATFSDCRGPGGCAIAPSCAADAGEACLTCDTSLNRAGDACPPGSEGKVRCDPTGASILRCRDGGLAIEFECVPPSACEIRNGTLSCYN